MITDLTYRIYIHKFSLELGLHELFYGTTPPLLLVLQASVGTELMLQPSVCLSLCVYLLRDKTLTYFSAKAIYFMWELSTGDKRISYVYCARTE